MKESVSTQPRRQFIRTLGLAPLPFLAPTLGWAAPDVAPAEPVADTKSLVNFVSDGLFFWPTEYVKKLTEINTATPIDADFYGHGGATKALEEAFAKLTGKQKAMYIPTGTMANQLAIARLSGDKTKVLVPENSHIYRDEADAAQSVHGKRLVPVGEGKPYFTRKDLEATVAEYDAGEVFHSGWGVVAVESPIRRADGVAVPLEVLKEISAYAQAKGYKRHLDGARIHIASAYTGVSVAEYASHFDTVYISLYKYLNAAGGAMLCGDAELIDKMQHSIKIYGGTVFQTWPNTAMALHYLNGIEARWKTVVETAQKLMQGLNQINGIHISAIPGGTNIYDLKLDAGISSQKLSNALYEDHTIWLGEAEQGVVKWMVNESLLQRSIPELLEAWKSSVEKVKK